MSSNPYTLHTILKSTKQIALKLALFGLFLGLVGFISSFVLPGTVHAAGGPGGGGVDGCVDSGPCTTDGWTWAWFNVTDQGPSYIFANGTDLSNGDTNWARIQHTCSVTDNSTKIYAFVILANSGATGIYSFENGLSKDSGGPEVYGSQIDADGTGTSSSIDNAKKAFNAYQQTPQAAGDGLTWDTGNTTTDVGWFCSGQRSQPNPPDADAHSNVSPGTIGKGVSTTFQHWVNTSNVSNSSHAEWDYRVEGCYISASNGSCNWSTTGCGNQTSSCPTLPNSNNVTTTNNYDSGTNGDAPPDINDTRNAPPGGYTYKFPGSATNGDQYCQRLEINPDSTTIDDNMDGNNADDGSWYPDNGSCVTYSYTPHPPATPDADAHSTVSSDTIAKGKSTTFQHWVNTTNASSSTNAGWQYRVEGCFVQSGNATGNPSDCSSAWSTTGCGSQQPGCPTLANATGIRTANNYDSNNPPALGDTRDNPTNGITYSFPSSAKNGDEYCQRLEISVDTVTIDNDMDGNNHSDGSWYTDNGVCVTYEPGGITPPTYSSACYINNTSDTGEVTFTVPGSTTNPYQAFVGVSGTQNGISVSDSSSGARQPIPYTSTSQTSQPPGNPGSPYTYIIRINEAGDTQNITVKYNPGTNITVSLLIRQATSSAATSFYPATPTSNSYTCDTPPSASITINCNTDKLRYSFDDTDDSSAAVATITTGAQTTKVYGGDSSQPSRDDTIDISQYVGFQPVYFNISVPDVLRNGSPGSFGAATDPQNITCPPHPMPNPPQIFCGSLGGVGSGEEAGTPFQLTFTVTYTLGSYGAGPIYPTDYMTVSSSLPGGSLSSVNFSTATTTSATGTINIGSTAAAGTYPITWTLNDSSGVLISCSGSLTLYNYPYANFFGGDLTAGGGFGTTDCTETGNIYTYLNNNIPTEGGSGNQFGVEALGVIEGLSSDSLNTSGGNYSDLSFANSGSASPTGNAPNRQFGGQYGVSNNCVPDYYADMPNDASTDFSGTLPSPPAPQKYAYNITGPITIGSLSVPNNVNAAIYVNGNVYITGNITYSGSGSWNSVNEIPSLYIVAKGNIYIDRGVTQLDGVYVAQPNGTSDGVINTCANATGGIQPLTDANFASDCQNQLTVNGAFVAKNIYLDRTYSSLRYSRNGENPNSGIHSCGSAGSDVPIGETTAHDCAAEIFNFSPELYLSQPAITPNSGPGTTKFDYITTLPPVL